MRLPLIALVASLPAVAFASEEAPVSLTASDGSGLRLVSYAARAVVEEPLAFTELALIFENPRDRVIEGQFRVTLPRGATVSRFAMKLDQQWQEGEVVEKQAARRAYEDFLHRRQDPALLEQAAGNEFSARVFPIPARGRKELIVSWSHELPAAATPYVLPLRGLPEVSSLSVEVFTGGALAAKLDRQRFVPDKDLSVPSRAPRPGVRSGELAAVRVRAVARPSPDPIDSLMLLVDTSASRALGFSSQLLLVEKLIALLARNNGALPLTVAAFDQAVQVVYDGPASGFGAAQIKALRDRRPLGASDLSKALAAVLEQGKKAPRQRVVLVSDGVFTAGEIEGDRLLAAVAGLKDAKVARLDAIAVGGIREEALLRRLVTAKLPRTGAVLDGDAGAETIARRLAEATVARVPVVAEGAKLVWPPALEGVQAGDEAVVYVELAKPDAPLKLSVGGVPVEVKGIASIERPLLARAWAQARIAALLDRQDRAAAPKDKQGIRNEIVALSVKHRVLSPYTALLVLETEADYERFQIDRKALADILTVRDGRIGMMKGREPPAARPQVKTKPDPAQEVEKAKGESTVTLKAPEKDLDAKEEPKKAEASPADRPPEVEDSEAFAPREEERGRALRQPAPATAAPPPPGRPARDMAEGFASPADSASRRRSSLEQSRSDEGSLPVSRDPYEGRFKEVMGALAAKNTQRGFELAAGWREEQPGDVLALVALGEACERKGDLERAARAYGSIIDLFPARADLRRFAGGRLERLDGRAYQELAADSFARAAEQRADHPASHRMLAFALLRAGKPAQAFDAIEKGCLTRYPEGRFREVERILREDAGLIAAAWMKAEPNAAQAIRARLSKLGGVTEDKPSLRFVLTWETDANDVDFHILDARGGHAWYSSTHLPSGGDLYADVTTGYGPECFTIRLPPGQRAYPYKLLAHYYSRGPMGYGMGKLEIIEHDGSGGLRFQERPYVVMVDGAYVDLGQVAR